MKKIISILMLMLLPGIPAFAEIAVVPERVKELDTFVRHQLMITEADLSYSLNYSIDHDHFGGVQGVKSDDGGTPYHGNAGTYQGGMGKYEKDSKKITFDGKSETVLVHEIAHHYGASEDVARWVMWCYEESRVSPAQKLVEAPLYALLTPLKWFTIWINKTGIPGAYSEAELKRNLGSTEPWAQEQWRPLK